MSTPPRGSHKTTYGIPTKLPRPARHFSYIEIIAHYVELHDLNPQMLQPIAALPQRRDYGAPIRLPFRCAGLHKPGSNSSGKNSRPLPGIRMLVAFVF